MHRISSCLGCGTIRCRFWTDEAEAIISDTVDALIADIADGVYESDLLQDIALKMNGLTSERADDLEAERDARDDDYDPPQLMAYWQTLDDFKTEVVNRMLRKVSDGRAT